MVATARPELDSAAVLNAIVAARVARLRVSVLAGRLRVRRPDLLPLLEELEAASLLTTWAMPSARGLPLRVVTLSPLAAYQLGVRLDASGDHWLLDGEIEPRPRVSGRGPSCETDCSDGDGPGILSSVADPGGGPADVSLARWTAQAARYRRDVARADPEAGPPRIPEPRTLLGLRVQWQGPAMHEAAGTACPGCRGRHLGPMELCTCCHRWGLDHAMLEVGEPARPPSPVEAAILAPRAGRIAGRTSPLAATFDGAQASKAKVERDRLKRLREADAKARAELLERRRAAAAPARITDSPPP